MIQKKTQKPTNLKPSKHEEVMEDLLRIKKINIVARMQTKIMTQITTTIVVALIVEVNEITKLGKYNHL